MWAAGTFPTLAVCDELLGYMNYLHVKGGRSVDDRPGRLYWRSDLAEAAWPVTAIVRRVARCGSVGVVCLNPPHGRPARTPAESDEAVHPDQHDDGTLRDLVYVRTILDHDNDNDQLHGEGGE